MLPTVVQSRDWHLNCCNRKRFPFSDCVFTLAWTLAFFSHYLRQMFLLACFGCCLISPHCSYLSARRWKLWKNTIRLKCVTAQSGRDRSGGDDSHAVIAWRCYVVMESVELCAWRGRGSSLLPATSAHDTVKASINHDWDHQPFALVLVVLDVLSTSSILMEHLEFFNHQMVCFKSSFNRYYLWISCSCTCNGLRFVLRLFVRNHCSSSLEWEHSPLSSFDHKVRPTFPTFFSLPALSVSLCCFQLQSERGQPENIVPNCVWHQTTSVTSTAAETWEDSTSFHWQFISELGFSKACL